jgi:hypothetical protein
MQIDKTTIQAPYNLIRDIKLVPERWLASIHLKIGINQNNKIKDQVFKLYANFFRNYAMTPYDVTINGAFQLPSSSEEWEATTEMRVAWARSIVNFITDIKAKSQ